MLEELRLPTGYFDRSFFMYFEDVDLGWRARLAGWEAAYVPSATVFHAFHGSAKRKGRRFVELHCRRNRVRMALKNGSPSLVARMLPKAVRDVFWAARVDGIHAFRDFAQAARDGVRQRRAVTRRSRAERREVERRWVVRSK
jgi:GT2 family glycosyltransferase